MSEKFIRWYDKNPDLSHFMSFVEKLPEEIQEEIAEDLIQIISNELSINHDVELFQLTQSRVNQYRRWYDNNLSLHSAVEMIKNFDDDLRNTIIHLVMESVVQIVMRRRDE